MSRLLSLAVACMISSTLAFSQARVTQQPQPTGGQHPNSVRSVPNGNGSELSTSQGNAVATPSTSNQALPGNANPANAAEGYANGQVVTPKPSQSGPSGTAAGNAPPTTDGNANNPETGTTLNTAKPGAGVITTWLWAALVIVAALMLIGILMRRDRSRGTVGGPDRRTLTMTELDRNRRDRDIRRVG
jgi:cytoskeletal protein RodZ